MTEPWRVWGRVAGPRLPRNLIQVGNIHLGPAEHIPKPPDPVSSLASAAEGYSNFSVEHPFLRVSSPCYMWVDVDANLADEAIIKSRNYHVPLLITALSTDQPGAIYRVQVTGAQDRDHGFGARRSATLAFFAEEPLDASGVESVNAAYAVLLGNAKAKNAAMSFHRGDTLQHSDTSTTTRGAALLAYFQVIESIANAIPYNTPSDHEKKQARLLSDLARSLETKESVRKRVADVRETAKGLDRLDFTYLSLKIGNAADVLKMPARWRSLTTDLGKLRNTRLGHGGGELQPNILAPWFPEGADELGARWLVQEFLEAFIRWLKHP